MMAKQSYRKRKKLVGQKPPRLLIREVLAAADRGDEVPVYLLYGDEGYLIRDTAEKIIAKLLPNKQQGEFSLEVLSGRDVSVADFSNVLSSLPLFATKRIVWLRGCGLFGSEARAKTVCGLLPQKGQGVIVIITELTANKGERGSYIRGEIAKRGVVAEFRQLSDTNNSHLRFIHDIVTEKLKVDGKEITTGTLFYLIQLVGSDLQSVLMEVEKLAMYTGRRRKIGKSDIDLLVAPTRETVAYQLAEAVTAGDLKTALSFLRRILDQNGKPLVILGSLVKRVRLLVQAKAIMESGTLNATLVNSRYPTFAEGLKSLPDSVRGAFSAKKGQNLFAEHPYVIYKVCKAAQRKPMQRLREQLNRMVDADRELKGGRRSKSEALEDLVIYLCG